MKSNRDEGRGSTGLLRRYRHLFRDLRSHRAATRRGARRLLAVTVCVPIIVLSLAYVADWELTRCRILRENAAFSALYPMESLQPSTFLPSPSPSAVASASPTASLPSPSAESGATSFHSSPSAASPNPAAALTPLPVDIAVDATREPLATPDADTLIYALQTPPPAQSSFGDLLALNPETVGFLSVEGAISLPVVQRKNDNTYYLNHSFNGEESSAGTLFLDGSNLLVPEDEVLIVYGHNMRNGTMFRPLTGYENWEFLINHALVRFDTLYENRYYLPFAVLSVTADPTDEGHLNLRQFSFDDGSFDAYVDGLRRLSLWEIPIEVVRGDRLLLLVTCEYTHENGRFVVALRALRPGEDAAEAAQLVKSAKVH